MTCSKHFLINKSVQLKHRLSPSVQLKKTTVLECSTRQANVPECYTKKSTQSVVVTEISSNESLSSFELEYSSKEVNSDDSAEDDGNVQMMRHGLLRRKQLVVPGHQRRQKSSKEVNQ